MRVAVVTPFYVPSHKAGGPIPGIQGILATLTGHDVTVVTGDRDLGDAEPFPPPYRGRALVDGAGVVYLPPLRAALRAPEARRAWRAAVRTMVSSDICYFNSLHSLGFTLLPMAALAAAGYRGAVIVSPRGELAASARALGRRRVKQAWARLLRATGWDRSVGRPRNVGWLASSAEERADILAVLPRARVWVSPERLRPAPERGLVRHRSGPLKCVAVGRVAPVKGTLDLVRALAFVEEEMSVELVGPWEDADYVALVREAADALPRWVRLEWTGPLPAADAMARVRAADLFVSLTRGENFGHAIGEALRDGCPVVLSDRTPWTRQVSEGAGQVLSEAQCREPKRVAACLDGLARMSPEEFATMSAAARSVGEAGLEMPGSAAFLDVAEAVSAGPT